MRRSRARWITIAIVSLALGTIVALVLVSEPIAQMPFGYTLLGSRLYSYMAGDVPDGPTWTNFTYRGVGFDFHACPPSLVTFGEECAAIVEPGGLAYSTDFTYDGEPAGGGTGWTTRITPSGASAIEFQPGGLVHLLVSV